MPRYTHSELFGIISSEVRSDPNLRDTLAGFCLLDEKRTMTLMEIVKKATIPGSVATEVGAGSGILGLAFLNAGGKYLYSFESDEVWLFFIDDLARELGFKGHINVRQEDAARARLPEAVDMVIAELVHTGLTNEPYIKVMRNIKNYTHTAAVYVPQEVLSVITLFDGCTPLTNPVVYDRVPVKRPLKLRVDTRLNMPVIYSGVPTEVAIDTKLIHPNGVITGEFDSLCPRLYGHIHYDGRANDSTKNRRLTLRPGDNLRVHVRYDYGTGGVTVSAKLSPLLKFTATIQS